MIEKNSQLNKINNDEESTITLKIADYLHIDNSYNFLKRKSIFQNDIISKKRKEKKERMSLIEFLKFSISLGDDISPEWLRYLRISFNKLITIEDDLTLLILENCALDALLHGLKIFLKKSPPSNENQGCFKPRKRIIEIYNHLLSLRLDYSDTLIHEFTHAMCFFVFKPSFFFDSLGLPYMYRGSVSDKSHVNPSELKFKQCIREDLENLKKIKNEKLFGIRQDIFSWYVSYVPLGELNKIRDIIVDSYALGEELKNFFTDIEKLYKAKIFENKALVEVLPFYIQYRAKLLYLAKELGASKREAFDVLSSRLPRIHDYCETDLKRILKNRLKFFKSQFENLGFESTYLSKHQKSDDKNEIVFKRDVKHVLRGFWYENLTRVLNEHTINYCPETFSL